MKRSDSKRDSRGAWTDSSLCKKTFAISIKGNVSHVICYYTKEDVQEGRLSVPSHMPLFQDLDLPREYIDPSNFRLHPKGSNYTMPNIGSMAADAKDSVPLHHSPLGTNPPMKQMEPIINVTPRPSPQPEEGFVLVRLWNSSPEQTLKISLSNGWNVFILDVGL
jgi:hypothetical protein